MRFSVLNPCNVGLKFLDCNWFLKIKRIVLSENLIGEGIRYLEKKNQHDKRRDR